MKIAKANGIEEKRIAEALAQRFPAKSITVRRYNSASIRARVIHPLFDGKPIVEREALVDPLIANLPKNIQAQITILLLLSPKETKESLMNLEFDEPSPTLL